MKVQVIQPAFFIIGVQRSGTTLLRVMLDRHPRIAIPPASHFIPWLFARRDRYGRGSHIDRPEQFVDDLSKHPRFAEWDMSRERLADLLAHVPDLRFVDAISALYSEYAISKDKEIAGDKTASYAEHIPLLSRLFPTAAFIHIIRDGRDVALSIMDMNPGHQHTPASAAFFWRRRLDKVARATHLLTDRRYCEVRYESLVQDPDAELRRLCDFLGVGFEDEMLEHDDRVLRQFPAARQRLHKNLALPPTKGLRNFRVQMDPSDIAEFEAIAGRQLLRAGYPLARPRPSPATRIRGWWHVARFAGRDYYRRRRPRRSIRRRRSMMPSSRQGG